MAMPSDIHNMVSMPALFEQLAEECVELAHASLKMARIIRGENPTPADEVKVLGNIIEEIGDIQTVIGVLGLTVDHDIMQKKLDRWYERLVNKK